jgi:hypothetical protein
MVNPLFPNAASQVVDSDQRATIPWYSWFISVNKLLDSGVITNEQLTDAVLKIVAALGSTDGTADTIIDVAGVEVTGVFPVIITGSMADGFVVKLPAGFGETHGTPFAGQHLLRRNAAPRGKRGQSIKGDKGDKGESGPVIMISRRTMLRRSRPVNAAESSSATTSDVTSGRALNTTYTNGGSALLVSATVRCAVTLAGGNAYAQGKSDGSAPPTTVASGKVGIEAGLLGEDNSFELVFVVAPGLNYRIDSAATNGTVTLGVWFETVL